MVLIEMKFGDKFRSGINMRASSKKGLKVHRR
jgi:hypothetical protein